jgi:hypothetical protein
MRVEKNAMAERGGGETYTTHAYNLFDCYDTN